MSTKTWLGGTGSYSDATQWAGGVVPVSGDTAVINAGTVTASGVTLTNMMVQLNGNSTAGTLALNNDTIDSASVVTINDANMFGASPEPTVTLTGTTTNNGTVTFLGTSPIVSFAAGAVLVNTGTINLTGSSPQIQTSGSAGAITNNGVIQVTNTGQAYQAAIVNATIGGTGTINIGNYGQISLRQSVASGQTVAFTGGVNAGSTLEIDAPGAFGATVTGFASGESLVLTSIPYSNFTYTSTGSSSGTLTLLNGATVESQVNFSGVYTQGSFTVLANALGGTGLDNLTITTSVTNPTTGTTTSGTNPTSPTGTVGAVYRFFDKTYGTHFFTADAGEKNTILATRPDLQEETNGFGDVAQSDPNSTAVYRFFDKTYGTHFFTASSTERDTILNTRPDLGYEPGSTFYEHSAQQSGDVAVYRFFDTQLGTHFYTGSATEYASLTTQGTPTYRANLTYEGVGFYAPAGTFT